MKRGCFQFSTNLDIGIFSIISTHGNFEHQRFKIRDVTFSPTFVLDVHAKWWTILHIYATNVFDDVLVSYFLVQLEIFILCPVSLINESVVMLVVGYDIRWSVAVSHLQISFPFIIVHFSVFLSFSYIIFIIFHGVGNKLKFIVLVHNFQFIRRNFRIHYEVTW